MTNNEWFKSRIEPPPMTPRDVLEPILIVVLAALTIIGAMFFGSY